MHPPPTQVTVLRDCVVIGPAGGAAEEMHGILVHRVEKEWQDMRSAAAAPEGERDVAAVVREALDHLRDGASGISASVAHRAAVVHRRDASVSWLTLAGSGRPSWSGIRALSDVTAYDRSRTNVTGSVIADLVTPWSGLLAVPEAAYDGPEGARLTWHTVLSGLRSLAPKPYAGQSPALKDAVGAAGATEAHWLLDGALTFLARHAVECPHTAQPFPAADRTALVYRVPDLPSGWRIARAQGRGLGVPGAAWGADEGEALLHAEYLAQSPTNVAHGRRDVPPSADDLLDGLSAASLRRLHSDVLHWFNLYRLRVLGIRVTADPLLGPQTVAWGPVWLG